MYDWPEFVKYVTANGDRLKVFDSRPEIFIADWTYGLRKCIIIIITASRHFLSLSLPLSLSSSSLLVTSMPGKKMMKIDFWKWERIVWRENREWNLRMKLLFFEMRMKNFIAARFGLKSNFRAFDGKCGFSFYPTKFTARWLGTTDRDIR